MEKTKMSQAGVPFLHLGRGEPLVLIHGLGEVKESWQNQYELADQYELIIPDLRGHGECSKKEGITIHNFASDVIGLLKELDIENAHILGLSMGGAVAQEIYHQAPSMVRSLLLISSFHYLPKELKCLIFKKHKALFEELSLNGIEVEYISRMALYSWRKDTVEEFGHFFKPKLDIFLDSFRACLEVDNLALLPTIKVPTLIIGSQYDSVLPIWIQAWMHKLIPNSQFIIMRNTGHIAKLEAKDRFNRHLRSFLKQQKFAA